MPSQTDWSSDRLLGLGEPRRHLEHALEHALVLRVGRDVLRDPDREGGVPRARYERVHVRVARAPAATGSSTEMTLEQLSRAAERHEQGVVGLPVLRVVARLDGGT